MEILEDAKIIWSYLKKYKKAVVKTAVLAVVLSIITAFIPYIYGRLIDIVSQNPSISFLILSLLGVWMLMSFLSAFLSKIVAFKGGFLSIDILSDFILQEINHIINLPLSFHKEKKSGEILSKINRASESLRNIIDDMVFSIIPQIFTVFIGIAILFFIDWRLSFGTLIIFLFPISIIVYRIPFITSIVEEYNKKSDKAFGVLNDSFLNIQTIKSCAVESFQKNKIKKLYKGEVKNSFRKLVIFWDSTIFFQNIVFSFGFVLIFGYAIYLLKIRQITSGELVMFFGYLNLVQAPLKNLLWQGFSFFRGMIAIKRARKLLLIKEEGYKKDGIILKEVNGKVEFKNVGFSYKKSSVLDNISFKVLSGQKIAIIGGSGEGKTTLVDLLSLYFIPQKGKILIDNIDIKKLNLEFLRKIIAYVPQEIILFNDTIKNNILYGKPKASEKEITAAAEAANIRHFIESLPKKYNTLVGERGIKLSTGQKQRIAIARALIRDPKILILDEATSSLDSESEKLVQNALEKLTKERTTFIIAHRLSTVRKADKILVLEKGKIIEKGTHQELIKKKGVYFKFYSLQFQTGL